MVSKSTNVTKGDEKEAERIAEEYERQLKEDDFLRMQAHVPDNITLEAFFDDIFLPHHDVIRQNKHGTLIYYQHAGIQMIEVLGKRKLRTITRSDVLQFREYLLHSYIMPSGKKLSNNTVNKYFKVLAQVLQFAMNEQYISVNPAKGIELIKVPQKEVKALSGEEITIFMREIQKEPLYFRAFCILCIQTGCRRGEIIGLQWQDINWNNKTISIKRTASESKGGVRVDEPKTLKSARIIPMTPVVKNVLMELSDRYPHSADEYIFHSLEDVHKPHSPSHFTKLLKQFCEKINISVITPHTLRHTFGTILYRNDVPIKTIQDLMGHTTPAITMQYYIANDTDKNTEEMNRVFGE